MTLITTPLPLQALKQMAAAGFGNMVKAVVDVERGVLAVDAELHADLEARLLEEGSQPRALWGINLYPALEGDEFVEFDSLINLRPSQGNPSRSVEDAGIRQTIRMLVHTLVPR